MLELHDPSTQKAFKAVLSAAARCPADRPSRSRTRIRRGARPVEKSPGAAGVLFGHPQRAAVDRIADRRRRLRIGNSGLEGRNRDPRCRWLDGFLGADRQFTRAAILKRSVAASFNSPCSVKTELAVWSVAVKSPLGRSRLFYNRPADRHGHRMSGSIGRVGMVLIKPQDAECFLLFLCFSAARRFN